MKTKINFLLFLFLSLIYNQVFAQILHQGSIVITHSPETNYCAGYGTLQYGTVVKVLDASNTSGIPTNPNGNKFVWTNNSGAASNWQTNPKPTWYSDPSWTYNNLGRVFGLTLDPAGNIYVANTSIYGGELSTHHDCVYKLNGITGVISTVYDFTTTNNSILGLGNIKVFQIGNVNYMAANCWEDGKIHILKEPVGGNGTWTHVDSKKPSFMGSISSLPYGIAVRPDPVISGQYQIFYGEYNTANTASPDPSNIYSVNITNSGNFTGAETLVAITGMPMRSTNWGTGNSISGTNTTITTPVPIADISFSSDYKRMVVGQQELASSTSHAAHNSRIQEFIESGLIWNAIGKYPCGAICTWGTAPNAAVSAFNSVGGVTYSNNILFQNGIIRCDTTILYSTDALYVSSQYGYPSNTVNSTPLDINEVNDLPSGQANFGIGQSQATVSVYGFQGLPSRNSYTTATELNAFYYSFKVDADDLFSQCDKYVLGDIEAYNVPCTPPCECGNWKNLQLNEGHIWQPGSTSPSSITVMEGNVSGVVCAYYQCNNDCSPTYDWNVTNSSSVSVATSSPNNCYNLSNSTLNALLCGNYTITVTPHCGNNSCPTLQIPLIITCIENPCNCGEVTVNIGASPFTVTPQTSPQNSNPMSTLSGSLAITTSQPITEVRVLLDEFRLSASDDNCLLCKNKPETWGNISSGNLPGISGQVANSTDNTLDTRELVFHFNYPSVLTNANLVLTLQLPGITDLSCCTVTATTCIKVIVRDINCCETEREVCDQYTLSTGDNTGHKETKKGTPAIFTPFSPKKN